jgi:hypothetical protein
VACAVLFLEALWELADVLWVLGANLTIMLGILGLEDAFRREIRSAVLCFEMEREDAARQLQPKVVLYSAGLSVLTGAPAVYIAGCFPAQQMGGRRLGHSSRVVAFRAFVLMLLCSFFLHRAVLYCAPKRRTSGLRDKGQNGRHLTPSALVGRWRHCQSSSHPMVP